jgi:GNAT superfamily N-acetyltransferase
MSKTTLQLVDTCRSVSGLRGHQPVHINRLQFADHSAIVAMLERCSKVSLQRRFHVISDGLSYVTRLLAGATGEIGYGAWLAGRCVGLASLHVADESSADMGVLVEDGWQRHGVGSALVTQLIERARQEGLSTVRADVLADNYFIPSKLARRGPTRTSMSFGVSTIWLSLRQPPADAEGAA